VDQQELVLEEMQLQTEAEVEVVLLELIVLLKINRVEQVVQVSWSQEHQELQEFI
jgi:hypothetical protein